MTPRQRRRFVVSVLVLCGAAATIALTAAAFRENFLFFYTPSQIHAGDFDDSRSFRLGGLVAENSVSRAEGDLEMFFVITDTAHRVTVSYSGVLPNLFREGQGVVARGVWRDGILRADEVLAKHDENYRPPEVEDALDAAKSVVRE